LTDAVLKKLGHMIEYGILALLIWWALHAHAVSVERRGLLAAFAVAVIYAASDEWHQTFVPGRNGNVYDWTVDLAGAGIALVGLRIALLRRGRQLADRNLHSAT
jgi:VanZ family protein